MTYKIFLLRHAKSSWDNQNLTDFERPLNQRGVNNATALGEYLKSINFKVDQILSSQVSERCRRYKYYLQLQKSRMKLLP